jgi:formate hydrogenlyase subunit 3/multisubunit Na+/H+ antiporter MnhD subunit
MSPGPAVELPWLLLGTRLGMDTTAQVFLFFTSLLWTCAGVYARAYFLPDAAPHRFFGFFLVTLSGNLGLILAQDVVSFYLFFAVMSFAAYGLVVHDGSVEAHRAGQVYIGLVVIGEVLLVSALLLIVPATGNAGLHEVAAKVAVAPMRDLAIGLMLAGFGIKVGALPLHVWLPLAHPVAPTPASAVLSGAMIKAGLLGWLRFLPLGEVALPGWGSLCMAAGLAAAFYGVAIGVTQDNAKTVLAYSSISQMGFMTVALGVGLAVPEAWPLALAAVLLYALHHALAKGALFLGVGVAKVASDGVWQRRLILIGLLLPALALAGAPFTSGAVAKLALKTATALVPAPWSDWLGWLLPVAAVGTTLLMGRFLSLVWPSSRTHGAPLRHDLWLPWAALLTGVVVAAWLFTSDAFTSTVMKTLSYATLWPVTAGALLVWAVWRLGQTSTLQTHLPIPAGDLLVLTDWLVEHLRRGWSTLVAPALTKWLATFVSLWHCCQASQGIGAPLVRMEGWLGRWASAGMLFLLLAATLFTLLAVM